MKFISPLILALAAAYPDLTVTNTVGLTASATSASISLTSASINSLLTLQSGETTASNWIWKASGGGGFNLATNQNVWTWPVNLSCVGQWVGMYEAVLLTPSVALGNSHFSPQASLWFCGSGGIMHTSNVAELASDGDIMLYTLASPMPSDVTPCWVFGPDLPNRTPDGTCDGLVGVWPHNNNGKMDMVYLFGSVNSGSLGGPAISFAVASTNSFGNDTQPASGGDSGAPVIVIVSNLPVVVGTLTSPSELTDISNPNGWSFLTNYVPVPTLQVLPTQFFQQQNP